MKFTTILASAFAACISVLTVAAAPVTVELERRTTPPLPSHLHTSSTFYRAVTRGELAHIANYPKGGHPKSYAPVSGDFSHEGALYTFADLADAHRWGDAFSSVAPDSSQQHWYLVKFKYTPNKALKTKSFAEGTDEWKEFVTHNYKAKSPIHYDIVEGPVSIGHGPRMKPFTNAAGQMLYQAAFIGDAALASLTIEDVTKHVPKSKERWCPSCVIM